MKATMAIALLILLAGGSLQAQNSDTAVVYKWVDENGVPQYTDRPPSDTEAQRTAIVTRRTDPAAVQARIDEQASRTAELVEQRREEREEGADAAAQRAETEEQRRANCEQAKQRLETYETSRRLYKPLPNGGTPIPLR